MANDPSQSTLIAFAIARGKAYLLVCFGGAVVFLCGALIWKVLS